MLAVAKHLGLAGTSFVVIDRHLLTNTIAAGIVLTKMKVFKKEAHVAREQYQHKYLDYHISREDGRNIESVRVRRGHGAYCPLAGP